MTTPPSTTLSAPAAVHERLTLGLAGTARRRAEQREDLLALARAADPDALAGHLADQSLLALLGRRALDLGVPLPPRFASAVAEAYSLGAQVAVLHEALLLGAQEVLGASQIRAVPFKG